MKTKLNSAIILLSIISIISSCAKKVDAPLPFGPIPSKRQLEWHNMEYYGFIHFNMNTFTNMEWGNGSEKPEQFNPTALDARQWAKSMKDAGMKGVIITAKHHDGFSLWPSKYTEHSVKNSPWKNGKGDVLKDLSEACKEFGLKLGMYLSPWDRNHAQYGTPEYVTYFHNQLRELLTNYGEIFEVWFDGANGGSGYYGGANETRKIDNKTYYQWDKVIEIVRELQPNAVIFGDGGPGVRWVGNEEGWANETNWSLIRKGEVYPGYQKYKELRSGHENGTHWVPAECDVSIRPGWYYHPSEDTQVKSLNHLVNIYYQSVGRNASLLLNLPVDYRGLIHEKDVEQLNALKQQIDKDFAKNLATETTITSTNHRGNSADFDAKNTIDKNPETYWATDDTVKEAAITLAFKNPTEVNRILLEEYIPLGQRVTKFIIEAEINGTWKIIDSQTTIGDKRILRFDTVKASKIRVNITAKAAITISNIELYRAPNLLTQPKVSRNKNGMVTMTVVDKNIDIYYTTDGTEPNSTSLKYENPFVINSPTHINVAAYNSENKELTKSKHSYFDVSKKNWKVLKVSSGKLADAIKTIDDNLTSSWMADASNDSKKEIIIDLGKNYDLSGFTYMPIQGRWPRGIISHYKFSVSTNNRTWKTVANGEFGNIKNNPIEQTINFNKTRGRFIKLKAIKIVDKSTSLSVGEIGVITE